MSYFKIEQGLIRNSGIVGTQVLSPADLSYLVDGVTTTSGVTVSGTIGFDVVLGQRFEIGEIRYYYTGSSSVQMLSSQEGDEWDTLPFESRGSYVSVSGTLLSFSRWPSVLRVVHTALAGSSTAYEISIFGRPVEPLLGGSYCVDATQDAPEVSPVVVRNPQSYTSDVHCFLPYSEALPNLLSISVNPAGGFAAPHAVGFISGSRLSVPAGIFSGTTVSGESIVLSPGSGEGWYYSPVLDTQGSPPLRAFCECLTVAGTSSVDWDVSSDGNVATMAVRSSNVPPTAPWVSGVAPQAGDLLWGVASGTLSFVSCPTDALLGNELCHGRYVQAALRLATTNVSITPVVARFGFEEATTLSGVLPLSSATLFVRATTSSYMKGYTVPLITFTFLNEH